MVNFDSTRFTGRCLVIIAILVGTITTAEAQNIRIRSRKEISGTVAAIKPGEITIKDEQGDTETFLIQDKTDRAVSVGGTPTRIPAAIQVSGSLPIKLIEPGMIVMIRTRINVYGKPESALDSVRVANGDFSGDLNVEFLERPEKNSDFADVDIVARVRYIKGTRLQLQVPKAKWAKKEKLTFDVTSEAKFTITDDSLSRVQVGDKVTRALILQLTDEDWAVRQIKIDLSANRQQLSTEFDDQLDNQFSDLSDEPGKPREIRSAHFILKTDVSDRSAQILLAKLETMFELVSGYYRSRPNSPIQCYVVRDLRQWNLNELHPAGIAKIQEPAGVTISRKLGNRTRSIVYACDDHGVVQHEAVHAFCSQTFGSAGPVWYAEGMAEMGNYWKPGNLAVDIDPVVINYLTTARPKKMADIVAAGQITGDSWRAYAWRWALCHLLASNPNYSRRFKTLGVNLMAKKEDSFETAFGEYRKEISFEYDQFVKNFDNGYRVDLCVWDWKTKAKPLSPGKLAKQTIKAKSGWQATRLRVEANTSYDIIAEGTWKCDPLNETDADGGNNGKGRLIGVVLNDYQLSEPFVLGRKSTFVAPSDGHLFVRCEDDWSGLSDNEGELKVYFRRTPKNDKVEN